MNKRAASVLHVLAPGHEGGLESVVRALATGQRSAGLDVRVLAMVEPSKEVHPFVRKLHADGTLIEARAFAGREYSAKWRLLRETWRQSPADIVHTHGYVADVLARMALVPLGATVVSTVHGFTGGDRKNRIYEWLQVRAYRRFAGVAAVSTAISGRLIKSGVSARRVQEVPNAWAPVAAPLTRAEARTILGLNPNTWCVAWIGRLSHEKGIDVLLRAVATLARPDFTFAILGDGPELQTGRDLAHQLGISKQVLWYGSVSEAARYLAAFDALALSSRTEGTPMVLLEAMGAGLPIVATEVGGVPALIGDNAGLLVPPDSPKALRDAIANLHDDAPSARKRAATANERVMSRYAVHNWVARYNDLYESALRTTTIMP